MTQQTSTNLFRESPDGPVRATEIMRQTTQGKLEKSDGASDVVVMNPTVSRLGFEMSDNMKLAAEVAMDIAKIAAPIAGLATFGAFAWSNPVGALGAVFAGGAIHGIYDMMVNGGLIQVNYIDSRSELQVAKDEVDMAMHYFKWAEYNLNHADPKAPEQVRLPLEYDVQNTTYRLQRAIRNLEALLKKTN